MDPNGAGQAPITAANTAGDEDQVQDLFARFDDLRDAGAGGRRGIAALEAEQRQLTARMSATDYHRTAADAMQWRAFGSRLLDRNPARMSLVAA